MQFIRLFTTTTASRPTRTAMLQSNIPRDVLEFIQGYPHNNDDTSQSANLLFYQNKGRCRPDNLTIDELHDKYGTTDSSLLLDADKLRWQGDYKTLEYKHGFIQWLFPIQEFGMNFESQPLQRHELDAMKSSPEVIRRMLTSYRLMLDFYGMRLEDEESGLLARASPPRDFVARYKNLVRACMSAACFASIR